MRYNEYAGDHILRDAFHLYRRNNITRSQTAFSRRILGMKPSYYSCMWRGTDSHLGACWKRF